MKKRKMIRRGYLGTDWHKFFRAAPNATVELCKDLILTKYKIDTLDKKVRIIIEEI